ncbi:hypothetical protein L3X38_038409 [Prunus dulcis]|uniref:Uncharacterized protein n=1 Tax=Prunus dulcis TaxID=3755 RepID=A0AAD4V6G3_PRUDU|nr:hypothetical protein L3X38_038409 [Prunus dulcis]
MESLGESRLFSRPYYEGKIFPYGGFLMRRGEELPFLSLASYSLVRQVIDQELKALERAKSRKTVQFPHPDFGSVECLILDSPHVLLKNIYRVPETRHPWKYILSD